MVHHSICGDFPQTLQKKHNNDSFLEIEEMEVENEIELDREGHVANTCKDIKEHNKACFILNLEVKHNLLQAAIYDVIIRQSC